MHAATTSGPAHAPRPASSAPATSANPARRNAVTYADRPASRRTISRGGRIGRGGVSVRLDMAMLTLRGRGVLAGHEALDQVGESDRVDDLRRRAQLGRRPPALTNQHGLLDLVDAGDDERGPRGEPHDEIVVGLLVHPAVERERLSVDVHGLSIAELDPHAGLFEQFALSGVGG